MSKIPPAVLADAIKSMVTGSQEKKRKFKESIDLAGFPQLADLLDAGPLAGHRGEGEGHRAGEPANDEQVGKGFHGMDPRRAWEESKGEQHGQGSAPAAHLDAGDQSSITGSHLLSEEFVGARYYFTDNFAVMGELGYGIAVLKIGVALKF